MGITDDLLSKVGLKYEDLSAVERATLEQWLKVLDSNQLSTETVQSFVHQLRDGVESELSTIKETPQNWIGVLALFVPFYGLIKKWYQDQNRIYLEARLRNLVLIEAFLISPKKARQAVERAILGMANKN